MTTFLDLMPKFDAPALCATEGSPDDWHPPTGGGGIAVAERAKAVCRRCPALEECKTYALAHPYIGGVWGAMSAHDRKTMRRVVPGAARKRSHCSKGHEWTPENLRRDRDGQRCRLCHNAADRAKRARKAS